MSLGETAPNLYVTDVMIMYLYRSELPVWQRAKICPHPIISLPVSSQDKLAFCHLPFHMLVLYCDCLLPSRITLFQTFVCFVLPFYCFCFLSIHLSFYVFRSEWKGSEKMYSPVKEEMGAGCTAVDMNIFFICN